MATIVGPITAVIGTLTVSDGGSAGSGAAVGTGTGTGAGTGTGTGPSGLVFRSGDYDVLIGGIPFTTSIGSNGDYTTNKYRRQTEPYKTDQVDQSAEPGEHSLQTWWLRSQSTFHLGAGRLFMEPDDGQDTNADFQFETSRNVDVWTPGTTSLLPRQMPQSGLAPAATGGAFSYGFGGYGPAVVAYSGSSATVYHGSGDALTATAWTGMGTTGTILSACTDGFSLYFADATGIYNAGNKVWNTGSSNVVIRWVKQRLMGAIGGSVYELEGTGGPALPASLYDHPLGGEWTWTAIAEGPDAIYAAGYSGAQSEVFKFLLDTSGDVPVLSTGIAAAVLPAGEQVYSMESYLNGYLVLGTNRGMRVCLLAGSGDGGFTLGSLCYRQPDGAGPVTALVGDDRFVYGAFNQAHDDGTSGLVRVDLSQLISTAKYAYAPDRSSGEKGTVLGVALFDGRLATLLTASDTPGGLVVDSTTLLAEHGFVRTGRIRYHTLDDKLFKFLRMRCAPLAGSIQATVFDSAEQPNAQPLIYQPQGVSALPSQPLGLPAQEYASLQFDMFATSAGSDAGEHGPTFRGYQLKSLPAARRQRQEMLVLNLFDNEVCRNGQRVGFRGWAVQRLLALEALQVAADGVLLEHLTALPVGSLDRLVVIDDIQYVQADSPGTTGGWGGYVNVTVHSVDEPPSGI